MKWRTYDKHEPAPCSLCRQNTFTSRYISDHKNTTRKKQENDGRRASTSLCLCRGGLCFFLLHGTPFSTAPMSYQSRCLHPRPLFHCPHALKMYFREWQQLKPPFPLPPCPERSFHPMPTPQTPLSTHPPDPVGFSHPPPCVQLVLIVEGTTARPAWIPRQWRCSRRSQACPRSRCRQHGRPPSRSPRRRSLWASPGRGQFELAKSGIRPRPRRSRCSPGVHPSRRPLPRHRTCPRTPWQSSRRGGSRSSRGKPPPPPPRGSPSWSAASRSPPWTPQTPRPSPAPTPSTSPSSRGGLPGLLPRRVPSTAPAVRPHPREPAEGAHRGAPPVSGLGPVRPGPPGSGPGRRQGRGHVGDGTGTAGAPRISATGTSAAASGRRNERKSPMEIEPCTPASRMPPTFTELATALPKRRSRSHAHQSDAPPPPTGSSSAETTTTRRDDGAPRRSEYSCPKQRHALTPQ